MIWAISIISKIYILYIPKGQAFIFQISKNSTKICYIQRYDTQAGIAQVMLSNKEVWNLPCTF